jgi:cellulose synthase (UDP-forming)
VIFPSPACATAAELPSAPEDSEVYWYFGPQQRWIPLAVLGAYALAAGPLLAFALHHWALWMFLAVLVVNAASTTLSLLDGQRSRRVTRDDHELLIRVWRPDPVPSADVFLPTCGEPLDVLRNAYTHVGRLSWDGPLAVWVLDDGGRDEVRALAAEHGFGYLSRPDRGRLKKAGNLNYALARTSGDVIAILDADFCPRPDFLRHLAPYLETPDVGIVQSPQHFDTATEMNWVQRAAGASQEWFSRWLQPSRDACDAAICCGSNALYRRAAVTTVGGFAAIDHSEDMYTGLAMLRAGYRTRYVPALLAKGLSPDTVPAFLAQQYRWALGNLHLLTDRAFRHMHAGWRLRLSYFDGVAGYLVAAVNVFAAPLPPLVMIAGFRAEIRPWHVLPLAASLWVWLVLLPMVSRVRWRIEVVRAYLLVSFASMAALVHTVRDRHAGWVPTGAGRRSPLVTRLSWLAFGWLGGVTLAGWVALAVAVAVDGPARYWGVGCYLAFTTVLVVPLLRGLWRDPAPRPAGSPPGPAEALAITACLVLFALVASGWVDAMLPWGA